MATSLSQVLLASPPTQAPYKVTICARRPYGDAHLLVDLVMPFGLVLRGCEVRGEGANRRVRTMYEFASREAKTEFDREVLAALDASE